MHLAVALARLSWPRGPIHTSTDSLQGSRAPGLSVPPPQKPGSRYRAFPPFNPPPPPLSFSPCLSLPLSCPPPPSPPSTLGGGGALATSLPLNHGSPHPVRPFARRFNPAVLGPMNGQYVYSMYVRRRIVGIDGRREYYIGNFGHCCPPNGAQQNHKKGASLVCPTRFSLGRGGMDGISWRSLQPSIRPLHPAVRQPSIPWHARMTWDRRARRAGRRAGRCQVLRRCAVDAKPPRPLPSVHLLDTDNGLYYVHTDILFVPSSTILRQATSASLIDHVSLYTGIRIPSHTFFFLNVQQNAYPRGSSTDHHEEVNIDPVLHAWCRLI